MNRSQKPSTAAKKLVQLMRRLPKHRGRKTKVSDHVKEHIYGTSAKSPKALSAPPKQNRHRK